MRLPAVILGSVVVLVSIVASETLGQHSGAGFGGAGGHSGFGGGGFTGGGMGGGFGGGGGYGGAPMGGSYGAGGNGAGGWGGGAYGGTGGTYGAGGYGSGGWGGGAYGGVGGQYGTGGYGVGGWAGGGYGSARYGGGSSSSLGGDSAYHTFGGGGFGAGKIYHPAYKAGAIGAGAYDPSGSSGTRTIYLDPGGNRVSGLNGPRSNASAPAIKANFVHAYASPISGMGSKDGRARGESAIQNHFFREPEFWRDRSYFFGYGSPFGAYLGYPWWWPGYGNRFNYLVWRGLGFGGYGLGGSTLSGYGSGYPYLPYQPVYPYTSYPNQQATADDEPARDELVNSLDYASQGEIAFRAGKYKQAVHDWRHALVDDPQNGAILLLLSQALFAAGQHVESAGALQVALASLPEDKWPAVVVHYPQLYSSIKDYTDQIRAAERQRDANPDLAPLHLVLGYHFGYLGYPKQAVQEFEKAVELSPQDEIGRKLLVKFAALMNAAPKPAEIIPEPVETGKEPGKSS